MYTPTSFVQSDPETVAEFIVENSFATLVSVSGPSPAATHLPLLLDRHAGENGTLIGHMARANSQWKSIDSQEVLAIFHGPHAHISSSWYETDRAVPTWNYVVAHVHGTCKVTHDRESVLQILQQAMEFYEQPLDQKNRLGSTNQEYIDSILPGVVGFRIAIERIEGTWKLSQNHEWARREEVIRRLEALGGEHRRRIAALMRASLHE